VAVRSCENQKRIHFVTGARTGCLLSHARGGGPTCPRAEAAGLPAGEAIDAARGAGQPRAPGFVGAHALGLRAAPARMRAAAGPRRRAPSCLGRSSTLCRGLPFVFISEVVVVSLTLYILGLEEEVAASRLEVDELRCHLNDLEVSSCSA
jgi:hypothetical protein